MTIKFDATVADMADRAANRITEPGKYIGKFTDVQLVTSQRKGTKGLNLFFESNDGGKLNLSLWYKHGDNGSAEGAVIGYGYSILQALMQLVGGKAFNPKPATVEVYDTISKTRIDVPGENWPDACDKQIGVVLEQENYTSNSGVINRKFNLVGVFEAATGLMVSEINARKVKPEKLNRLLAGLRIKTSTTVAKQPPSPSEGGYVPLPDSFGSDPDDIPF